MHVGVHFKLSPQGVVVTSEETWEILVNAFQVLNQVLPEDACHGRTIERGPKIFFTNDSSTEWGASFAIHLA